MPAFNEAPTIVGVLNDLYPRIDYLVIVDDGSRDATGQVVDDWARSRDRCTVIHFPENRGLSAALRAGWDEVRVMLARGEIRPDDVAFSIDADGQHEPAAIDGMIEHLLATDSACVIGRRDLSYHTAYKVIGNAVMTWIGRISGGHRFEDIESGYRVFRVGPLLEAQQYYEGYKYSETVEVAVLLTRLGYRVDNTYLINIPVARTRTRLYDAAVDAVCMPLAWYRLSCWREAPPALRGRFLLWLPVPVVFAAIVALGLMLTKPFYLGDDSAHSYAHVWYLSESLYTRHEWPWHVASLANGDAVMFPYAIIPWLPDAIVYPILGDRGVTLSMVLGVVLMAGAMLRFRPAMRNPAFLALFLLNPLLWNGITQFQLATLWSFFFFFLGATAFERRRPVRAVVLLALAIACQPEMGVVAIALHGAFEWVRTRMLPPRLVQVAAGALVVASPAVFLFLSTPLLRDATALRLFLSAADNLRRLSIVLLALLLPAAAPHVFRFVRPIAAAGAAATLAALVFLPPSGLWERSHARFEAYLREHPVVSDGSYRVMVKNNHEDGMVEFMKAGAILSSEFFTESEQRHTFRDVDAYACLLATTEVGHVILGSEYPSHLRSSEEQMLEALASRGEAELEFRGEDGSAAYRVHLPANARRGSVRDCHL